MRFVHTTSKDCFRVKTCLDLFLRLGLELNLGQILGKGLRCDS